LRQGIRPFSMDYCQYRIDTYCKITTKSTNRAGEKKRTEVRLSPVTGS
jgi:hypothetical protein